MLELHPVLQTFLNFQLEAVRTRTVSAGLDGCAASAFVESIIVVKRF